MGKAACEQVLRETGLDVSDVDAIAVATASPDRLLPSQACDLQATLGATNAAAFDVGAACSGFIQSNVTPKNFDGKYRTRQQIEQSITENMLQGLRETVLRFMIAHGAKEL